ncbi:MAG: hemerythrin domain-containing protein [bacterium]|nr:hemerythrin domain-containing protein [bacterium]MDZ4296223.1 hemerythrin domain-containing protein [Patescibacteria group bacterium]
MLKEGNPVEELNDDAVELIRSDHQRVEGLFRRFETAAGEERQEIADDILSELTAHAEAEERAFYPEVAAASGEMEELIGRSREEHAEMKNMVGAIRAMNFGEGYVERMRVLERIVMDHVEEEESTVLPEAEKMPEDKLNAIAREMLKIKMPILGKEKIG